MEEINSWSELTSKEKDNILIVVGSIFATIGTDESICESWYNSGYIRLRRDGSEKIIFGPGDAEDEDSELIELARITKNGS